MHDKWLTYIKTEWEKRNANDAAQDVVIANPVFRGTKTFFRTKSNIEVTIARMVTKDGLISSRQPNVLICHFGQCARKYIVIEYEYYPGHIYH